MVAYQKIIEEYIGECASICNLGGYTKLSKDIEKVGQAVLDNYIGNRVFEVVNGLVKICKEVTISYLDELNMKGTRIFSWNDCDESELVQRINNVLREV